MLDGGWPFSSLWTLDFWGFLESEFGTDRDHVPLSKYSSFIRRCDMGPLDSEQTFYNSLYSQSRKATHFMLPSSLVTMDSTCILL